MAAAFSLAGLLRIRRVQEDVAASGLAQANGRVRDNEALQDRTRRSLAGMVDAPTDIDTLRALASARASTGSMLAELDAAGQLHAHVAAEAQADYHGAKARTMGIEKLDTKHAIASAATELATEQAAIDEVAGRSPQKRRTT